MTTGHPVLGRSALQAYKADIPLGGMEPTREDHVAIHAATLLRHSLIGTREMGPSLRREAARLAKESLGNMTAVGCSYDDHPATSDTDVLRLLAQRTSHAGRLHLAEHLLESLAATETDPVSAGRILADRARVTRKMGFLDLSAEQARELLRIGRRIKSHEITALGHALKGSIAESRGNRVELFMELKRAYRVARAGALRRMQASALGGLGAYYGMTGQYGDAVESYWRAYQLVEGTGVIAISALGNLAQTLLVSGRPAEARKIATICLQSPHRTVATLPSLGCFALASANLGEADAVEWACSQVRQLVKSRHDPREAAEAMIECAAALEAVGKPGPAGVLRRRGEGLAQRHGFHDLTFPEAMQAARRSAQPPMPFHRAAAGAAAAIEDIEVPRIPDDLALLSV